MNYQEAWSYLDQLQFFKIKLGLDSMNRFLAKLGDPHLSLPCIHIGGTNGKGSVSATLLAILGKAGYRVGSYTSPHLSSVRERFRIGKSYISKEDFARHATAIKDVLDGDQITYFEFTTSLALLWFVEQKVDLALLEVGMGGRLDATNVVAPLVSVITNVSMDHEQYLGNTLAQIAEEKAGIIKPGIPVVSSAADDISRQVIKKRCARQQSPLFLLDRDFQVTSAGTTDYRFDYTGISGQRYHDLPLAMRGAYQRCNAGLALATLELLQKNDFTIHEQHIQDGLAHTTWPGRLEYFSLNRTDHPWTMSTKDEETLRYLLDGAHNEAGIKALKTALQEEFTFENLYLVWAAMSDKDLSLLEEIAELARTIILTRPESERSASPEVLQDMLPERNKKNSICTSTVDEALRAAWSMAQEKDLICVAGSLYLVGKARQLLLGELVLSDE